MAMDMANLSNNQQTSLINLATRQSFLLSDQAQYITGQTINVDGGMPAAFVR